MKKLDIFISVCYNIYILKIRMVIKMNEVKMERKVIDKKNFQAILKSLKGNDFLEITKTADGYEARATEDGNKASNIKKGDVLIKATRSHSAYYVRHFPNLLIS